MKKIDKMPPWSEPLFIADYLAAADGWMPDMADLALAQHQDAIAEQAERREVMRIVGQAQEAVDATPVGKDRARALLDLEVLRLAGDRLLAAPLSATDALRTGAAERTVSVDVWLRVQPEAPCEELVIRHRELLHAEQVRAQQYRPLVEGS